MQVTPIRDMVLVKLEPPPEQMASGLFRPKTATDKEARFATVLAVGPGRVTQYGVRVAPEVKPGDRVLICEYNLLQRVTRFGEGDDDLATVPEADIHGVVTS
jgi:chaperonin GroES